MIFQINLLQKDNESLMGLFHNKEKDNKNNENQLIIIEEKEKIIKELKNKINELKNKNENISKNKTAELKNHYENKIKDKNQEPKNLNSKVLELNNNLIKLNNNIKHKEIITNELKKNKEIEDIKKKDKFYNNAELNYEKIDELFYIENPKQVINENYVKTKFAINELIFEQIQTFSYFIKDDKRILKNNIDNNKEIEKLKNEIKELDFYNFKQNYNRKRK